MKEILAEVAREKELASADEVRDEARRVWHRRASGRPRKPEGAAPQKRLPEMPLAVQAKILKRMESELPAFASEQDFSAAMSRKMGMDRKSLKRLWQRKDKVLEQQSERNHSLLPRKHLAGKSGVRPAKGHRNSGRGWRLSGGGKKSAFPGVQKTLRAWFEEARAHGHSVKKRHLLTRWQFLLSSELLKLKSAKEAATDSFERARLDQKISEGEKQLQSSAKDAGKNRLKALLKDVGAKNLLPDLKTKLSEAEEQVSAKLTYQSLDHTLHLACFAPLEDLSARVAKPLEFRQNLGGLVVVCSDQIPLWIKAGSERELFADWEHRPLSQQHLRQRLRDHHLASSDQISPSGDVSGPVRPLLEAVKPSAKAASGSGQGQKRAFVDADSVRYRVTYEARQALYGLCKDPGPDGQPELSGRVLPGLLVVHGTHARLDNIDSSGRFLKDESFEFAGKLVCRKAGSSAGNLLRGWRDAREQAPHLFTQICVMSQPSANVDGIIFAWSQESLAAVAPASVHVRDCFAAAWSSSAAGSLFYAQSLQTIIGPKLTASLQLTDTDFSRAFKSVAREAMDKLRPPVCICLCN